MKSDTKIKENEICLKGKFLFKDGKIDLDDTGKRIEFLITHYLKKIRSDKSG